MTTLDDRNAPLDHGIPSEGGLAEDQLVQCGTQTELIAARVGEMLLIDLRCHVRRRTGRRTAERRVASDSGDASQAEVRDAQPIVFADENVLRLEIAVHQSRGVRGVEPGDRLPRERECSLEPSTIEARSSIAPLRERAPLHQLHHEVHATFVAASLVHRGHVGMDDPRHHLRLVQHPLCAALGDRNARQYFDRNAAIQDGIVCAIHRAHATATDQVDDLEAFDPHRRGRMSQQTLLERGAHPPGLEAGISGPGAVGGRRHGPPQDAKGLEWPPFACSCESQPLPP